MLAVEARRDAARPRDHDGRAVAAFVGRELGARGEAIDDVRVLEPAVVGRVDHDGVFAEAIFVETEWRALAW